MQPIERIPTGALAEARPVPGTRAPATWLRVPIYPTTATTVLLVSLVVVFLIEIWYSGSTAPADSARAMYDLGAKINGPIVAGQYWRLVTAMFLHADILHIGFNGYALLIFGQQIERFYSWPRFLAIYFLGGLAGSIGSFAFSPAESVGASGAIFGLLGAMGAFFWLHRRLLGTLARTMLWNALAIGALNLVLGFSQSGAIDNMAHLGGLVGGTLVGFALAPRYRPGRVIGPDERLLEDSLPRWVPPAVVMIFLAIEILLFALALAVQKGAL